MSELAHRGTQPNRGGCVGGHAPGHFQGNQRIAVDVDILGDSAGLGGTDIGLGDCHADEPSSICVSFATREMAGHLYTFYVPVLRLPY